MSLLKRLGLTAANSPRRLRYLDAVRQQLDGVAPERVEFVAAFAGLLVRVAYADLDVTAREHAALRSVVISHAGLSPAEGTAVVNVAVKQATELAGIDYAALTRAFNQLATENEKEHLIDCLFAIATADDTVSMVEDEEIRKVARALLLSHGQFIAIRSRYKEQLEVIQALRRVRRP
jgi:uncharacterized tellurite resistance protein B-like protein